MRCISRRAVYFNRNTVAFFGLYTHMNFASFTLRTLTAGFYTLAKIADLTFRQKATESDVFYDYAQSWARVMLRITDTEIFVREEVPTCAQSCIYASNHISLLDAPALLAALPKGVRFMYKQEIERVPIFGRALAKSPFIAVNRGNSREATGSYYQAANDIASGSSVLLFPEGTWSPDGELLPFKRGAMLLALRSGKPIVPVAIWGTQFALPPEQYRFYGGKVAIRIGEPIAVSSVSNKEEEQNLSYAIRKRIALLLEECRNSAQFT